MAEPLADPTTSPKDPVTGSGSTGELSSEKVNRGGRGVAIPHYIAAYKLTSEFMPRDEVGYYLTIDSPPVQMDAERRHMWEQCLKALYKKSTEALFVGQEIKTLTEFSKAVHSRLLQMNRQIRNYKQPGDLKVPFTKRNASALATYKEGELYKLWMQKQLPKAVTDLALEAELIQPTRIQDQGSQAAEIDTASYMNAAVVPLQGGGQLALPAVCQPGRTGMTPEQFTAFLTGSMNGSVTRRQTRNPANGTAVGDAKAKPLSPEGELQALRQRVSTLEAELKDTKEELAIQQSKLFLEAQHTRLLKRKYEGACPD